MNTIVYRRRTIGLAVFFITCGAVFSWASLAGAQAVPLAGTGYNENMVVGVGETFSGAPITATVDGGTSKQGSTWYQLGQNSSATSTGLPMGLSLNVADPTFGSTTFHFQGVDTNNSILLAGDGNGPTSATFTLSQSGFYNSLSFIAADGNGSANVGVTLNYAGGGTFNTTVNVGDWFGGSPVAIAANGRISSGGYDAVNSGNPRLYYYDLTALPTANKLQSITFNFGGGGSNHTVIMGVSGFLASPISWASAQNITSASDVLTVGLPAYAYAENSGTTTVNGVAFTGLNGAYHSGEASPNMTTTGFNSNYNGYGGGPSDYNGLMSGGIYYDASSGNGLASVGLNNLTAGHQYLVQYWVNDSRGSSRTETLSSPGGNTTTLSYDVSGFGQYGTGTFTAAGTGATIVVNGSSNDVQMNAVQLRDITNIGYWSRTAGATWDQNTTSNFCTNIYSAPAAFGTFSQATSATQTAYFGDYYYNSGSTVAVSSGSVNVAAGGVSTGFVNFINNAINYTVNSPDANGIAGSTAVNISGGGLVTLIGSHSYTGATTISAGTLQLGIIAGGQDGSLGGTSGVTNNGALVYNLAGTQSAPYAITGYGSLTKNGTGTLVLGDLNNSTSDSNSTFAGNVTVNGGTLIGAAHINTNTNPNATAFGAAVNTRTININAGATLVFAAANMLGHDFNWTTAPTLNINGGVVTNADPTSSGKVNNALNNVVLTGGTLTATTGEHEVVAGYAAWNVNGTITSSGNSVISTAEPVYGTVMLNSIDSLQHTSQINVQNGTLTVSAPLVQDVDDGVVSGFNQTGAGTLLLTSASNAYTGNSTVSGGTLQIGDGVAQIGNVPGNIVNNSKLVWANPTAQAFSGMISGSGSFTKTGAGTLNLTAQQSYTGATVIKGGTVKLTSAANVAGFGIDTSGLNGNPTWSVNNSGNNAVTPVSNNVLTVTGGNQSETRSAWANAPVSINTPFTVSFVYKANSVNGNIADGSVFVLQSSGTSAIGGGGGQLGYQGISQSVGVGFDVFNQNLDFFENGNSPTMSINNPGGINPASGDPIQVTLSYDGSGSIGVSLLDVGNGNTYSTTDPLSGSIASILGSNNGYMGFTGASGGFAAVQTIAGFSSSLTYSSSNILPASTALSIAASSTLDLNGGSQQVASLSGAGRVINSDGALSALVVGDTSTTTFSGNISKSAGGDISLTKVGAGTLVLSGSDNYTGGTTVTGGRLIVTSPAGLASGSNLVVGNPGLFPAAVVPSPVATSAATAVPEPGTLGLLAAAAIAAVVGARRLKGNRRLPSVTAHRAA
jgi:autotransporter-associated beta strand protein